MELKEFIKVTVQEIIDGTIAVQEYAKEHSASVNPGGWLPDLKGEAIIHDKNNNYGQLVDFDLAITVADKTEAKVGAGIFVAPFSLGGQGKTNAETNSVNKIKFVIPLFLPYQGGPREPKPKKEGLTAAEQAKQDWFKQRT